MAKKTVAKPQPKKTLGAKRNVKNDPIISEIASIITIAVSIFLIISIFTEGAAGQLGLAMKTGFVGLFGIGAYIFPFIVIGVSIYVLFASDKTIPRSKIISGCLVYFALIILFHVISFSKNVAPENLADYIKISFLNGSIKNGGLIGAVFGNFLLNIFDSIGTYIILITLFVVSAVILTGRSFFEAISRFVYWLNDKFSADEYYYEEEIEEEAEEIPEEKPLKKTVRKTAEKKPQKTIDQPPKRTAADQPPRRRAPNPPVNNKKVTDYTFVIEDTEPKEEVILLLNEEFSKEKLQEITTEPFLTKVTYEEAIKLLDERKKAQKQALAEEKPSIKLNMGNLSETSEPEEAETEIPPESFDIPENLEAAEPIKDIMQTVQADEPKIIVKNQVPHAVKPPVEKEKQQAEYGRDIRFNDSPAYEDTSLDESEIFIETTHADYIFPPIDLLNENPSDVTSASKALILDNSRKLEEALKSFGVEAKVIEVSVGPTVTRYELSPGHGVKVSKISGLSDDLALALAASGIRIEAPIPGKAAVGIEVPNKEAQSVYLKEVINDTKFKSFPSKLAMGLGKDIAGNVIVADIAKMPHMLIAGSTGSGKSVCINTLITSIIYKAKPEEVKLLMVDPKVVELKVYNGIPHLLIPVVTEPKKAAGALNWAVKEMTDRYDRFADTSVRDLKGYNTLLIENGEEPLPQIVIIIDELADLMMTSGKEVEEAICRLAQMARAAGIHLIIATQRPSVDVITGLIKANIPSKIAFAVSSGIDSRTILGESGAEKLLGRGDMLFYPTGMSKPLRVQGSFISDKEVESIVAFVKQGNPADYDETVIENITSVSSSKSGDSDSDDDDEYMNDAISFIISKGKASASMLQRQFRIGYNRASRIIEILEDRGIVGPEDGSKPRKVLMTKYEWDEYQDRRMNL